MKDKILGKTRRAGKKQPEQMFDFDDAEIVDSGSESEIQKKKQPKSRK